MEAKVYNQSGKEVRTVKLPDEFFAAPWNSKLVSQVVLAIQANARTPAAHAKGRGDVRGGGRKPWRQKGTGRARHGSRRSPIWVGGGVTHGPSNERDYSQKINKKMRRSALLSVLSAKYRDNEILFVDSIAFGGPKTKEAKQALGAWSGILGDKARIARKKKNAFYFALAGKSDAVKRSFSNISSVKVSDGRNANPVDLLSYKYLIVEKPESFLGVLEAKRPLSAGKKKKSARE